MADTLAHAVHGELVIKKSRFIACVEPCTDRAAAQARVAALRSAHSGAAHVCWALLAGGHSAAVDDGEPGGTAGRPMLDVLRHQGLEGVLATVVRYFGGVKLGAGGLVRAYTEAVATPLVGAPRVPLEPLLTLRCAVPYALEGRVRRELELASAELLDAQHGAVVTLSFGLRASAAAALRLRLDEAGQGGLVWV